MSENAYYRKDGKRQCRICKQMASSLWQKKRGRGAQIFVSKKSLPVEDMDKCPVPCRVKQRYPAMIDGQRVEIKVLESVEEAAIRLGLRDKELCATLRGGK